MCCIVGYTGKQSSRPYVLEGLTRLEYRGYDSAGFACLASGGKLAVAKTVGAVDALKIRLDAAAASGEQVDGMTGIGHTRWSSHGAVTVTNAHPHIDCTGTLAITHNGIIENHEQLRTMLMRRGHTMRTDTDSEIIAHLFEDALLVVDNLHQAALMVITQLQGAYACAVVSSRFPDIIVAFRQRSPLCIGLGKRGSMVASDPIAFTAEIDQVVYVPDEVCVWIESDSYTMTTFDGQSVSAISEPFADSWTDASKQGLAHYMLKEIYEQKQVVLATVNYVRTLHEQLVAEGSASFTLLKNASCFASVACGTSLHAAKLSEFFFEYVAQIPVASWCASELRSRYYIDTKPVVFAISQSGETADTLEAMRILLERGMAVIGITNTPKSSLSRESTYQLFTQSTREISVAATKTFTAQVALLYWLAHAVAVAKSTVPIGALERAEQELLQVGYQMQELLEEYKAQLTQWARTYARYDRFMTIGRQASYPLAQECALKLKEITYKMVDCYPAGELKHGALALIDEQTPTIVFSVLDAVSYQKLLGNVQEIKARGGRVLAFAFASQAELIALADEVLIAPVVPHLLGSLVLTGVMHYFSYQVAVVLDRPIDKPRNLAKSVTIE